MPLVQLDKNCFFGTPFIFYEFSPKNRQIDIDNTAFIR